jgi:hypothetical protein
MILRMYKAKILIQEKDAEKMKWASCMPMSYLSLIPPDFLSEHAIGLDLNLLNSINIGDTKDMMSYDKNDQKFQCNICDKRVSKKVSMRSHIVASISNEWQKQSVGKLEAWESIHLVYYNNMVEERARIVVPKYIVPAQASKVTGDDLSQLDREHHERYKMMMDQILTNAFEEHDEVLEDFDRNFDYGIYNLYNIFDIILQLNY